LAWAGYLGGPFEDRSGGLITFEAADDDSAPNAEGTESPILLISHALLGSTMWKPHSATGWNGRYWARTSNPQLVGPAPGLTRFGSRSSLLVSLQRFLGYSDAAFRTRFRGLSAAPVGTR
jgi:hypothetical protein